jgi:hypothetical protein
VEISTIKRIQVYIYIYSGILWYLNIPISRNHRFWGTSLLRLAARIATSCAGRLAASGISLKKNMKKNVQFRACYNVSRFLISRMACFFFFYVFLFLHMFSRVACHFFKSKPRIIEKYPGVEASTSKRVDWIQELVLCLFMFASGAISWRKPVNGIWWHYVRYFPCNLSITFCAAWDHWDPTSPGIGPRLFNHGQYNNAHWPWLTCSSYTS